jgi:transglutaminase-like putative cysteine protease
MKKTIGIVLLTTAVLCVAAVGVHQLFPHFFNSIFPTSSSSSSSDYGDNTEWEAPEPQEEPLPPPPKIEFKVTSHKKKLFKELFKSCNLSGDKKQLVTSCNYTDPTLRNQAVAIAGQSPGSFNVGQVCDIFDYCYGGWNYVNDPAATEVVEYASNTLANGLNGDCDDFAVLVCSMVLAVGGEARINYAYGQDGGHAFTEVNIGNTEVDDYLTKRYRDVYDGSGVWSRVDADGNRWLNLDWWGKHPGGRYFEYTQGTSFYILQEYCSDFSN